MNLLKTYYYLAKPGIIYGNVMTTLASFLFASKWHFGFGRLVATLIGTSLIIGAACVFNNIIDRPIDEKMARTEKRALVTGIVSVNHAVVYAVILGVLGFDFLALWVNWLTVVVGAIGVFFYVVVYGYFKRRSVHGTLIGSIAGSMPIVAGYTAATGKFTVAAVILFLILATWQMPHFYAIGLYRLNDYRKAGLPIWPVRKGVTSTKRWILVYTILYVMAALALGVFGYAGTTYMIVVGLLGLYWLWLGYQGLRVANTKKWARSMFGFSLITLLVLSAMVSVGSVLP